MSGIFLSFVLVSTTFCSEKTKSGRLFKLGLLLTAVTTAMGETAVDGKVTMGCNVNKKTSRCEDFIKIGNTEWAMRNDICRHLSEPICDETVLWIRAWTTFLCIEFDRSRAQEAAGFFANSCFSERKNHFKHLEKSQWPRAKNSNRVKTRK